MPVQQPAGRPEGRYDDRPAGARPGAVAVLVAVGALFVGWVVWAALGAASPGPGADVTAFRVVSAREIEVRVAAAPGSSGRFSCSVRAVDRTREVVGVTSVTLDTEDPEDAGRDGDAGGWLSVRTRERAVTATVGRCSAQD